MPVLVCPRYFAQDSLRLVTPTRALGGQRRLGLRRRVSGGGPGRAPPSARRRRPRPARVALQAAQAAVAAVGHQLRQLHVVLGEVRQRGVTELMQRPPGSARPAAPRPGGTTTARGRSAGKGDQRPVHGPGSGAGSTGTPARPGARRPAIRRGSSRALPEPKNSQPTSPPLERVRAQLTHRQPVAAGEAARASRQSRTTVRDNAMSNHPRWPCAAPGSPDTWLA